MSSHSTGDAVDFLLSSKRDAAAAKRFFQKALRRQTILVHEPST
jgi:transposase-like protein